MMELVGNCFLPLLVVLVILLMFRFWEASKEFDSTEKHQHTLQEWGFAWILNLVLGFGRDCEFLGFIGVQFVNSRVLHECSHSGGGSYLSFRVGVGYFGVALAHVPRG